jgi:hypothetical protein
MTATVGKLVLGTGAEAQRQATRFCGVKIVWGIPAEKKPVMWGRGIPHGRIRFRFRAGKAAECWLRNCVGVIHCHLRDDGDTWGLIPQGENRTA